MRAGEQEEEDRKGGDRAGREEWQAGGGEKLPVVATPSDSYTELPGCRRLSCCGWQTRVSSLRGSARALSHRSGGGVYLLTEGPLLHCAAGMTAADWPGTTTSSS